MKEGKELIPIVIVAYNRPKSLNRLLVSLSKAIYNEYNIRLIISIDKGENKEVLRIAESFDWQNGEKEILYHKKKFGLRQHVLFCGNLVKQYDGIIMLEDDLYVARDFYSYTVQALQFSKNKSYISGISLYNYQYNELCSEPFIAREDGFDNYYMQVASSWGQAWSKKQWTDFMNWYEKNRSTRLESRDFPTNVSNWPKSSWKKYFMKYLVENNTFFLFPRVSLVTNFGDAGTHVNDSDVGYQVSLYQAINRQYKFSKLSESKAIYDVFYENLLIPDILNISKQTLCVDLYGLKKPQERFYLTRNMCDYKKIGHYGCFLRPHEDNIYEDIGGQDFILYDTDEICKLGRQKKHLEAEKKIRKVKYNIRDLSLAHHRLLVKIYFDRITKMFYRKLFKWKKKP